MDIKKCICHFEADTPFRIHKLADTRFHIKGGRSIGTQTFRPIVSSHHFLVRRFAPNSYLGKTFRPHLHSSGRRFAPKPYFRKTFRNQIIFQKDVSHPNHISERRFAPKPYFRKTFRLQNIFKKDVSHPFHYLERRFAPSSYFGKTFRLLIRKTFRPL